MTDSKGGKWYMRRSTNKVEGPFAAGLISRHILLGRLEMDHEVSENGQDWILVKNVPSLIPDILKADPDDLMQQERLMAARRWADERLATDRRGKLPDARGDERRSNDRRDDELDDVTAHRSLLGGRGNSVESKSFITAGLFLITIVILIVWAGYFAYQNKPEDVIVDCSSAPAFAVDWSNCVLLKKQLRSANLENALLRNARLGSANLQSANLRGANMAYIDLSNANLITADMRSSSLKGANLVGADMQGALLNGSDLSFANLTGANLRLANLAGAKLGKAIWIDGTVCAENSVGSCQ